MAKALFFVLACALIVAALAEFEINEETAAELEFMKRDADLLEYFAAEKRGMGQNLKKYKSCTMFDQQCFCGRRSGKVVFCNGAGNGDGI